MVIQVGYLGYKKREEKVEIEDVIAASGNANWGGNQPGDRNENWLF